MKVASWRSRMRRSDLCTCKYGVLIRGLTQATSSRTILTSVGSASPMMMLRIEM